MNEMRPIYLGDYTTSCQIRAWRGVLPCQGFSFGWRSRGRYAVGTSQISTIGEITTTRFDIMGKGPMESNAKGDALIENGNTGNSPTEQLLGRGQGCVRSQSELSESVRSCCNQRGGHIRNGRNARGFGASNDRRFRRNNPRPKYGAKEIATQPEVATYQSVYQAPTARLGALVYP